jgi:hypothetical protein
MMVNALPEDHPLKRGGAVSWYWVRAVSAGVADLVKEIQTEHADTSERLMNEAAKWREQCFGSRMNYGVLLVRYE